MPRISRYFCLIALLASFLTGCGGPTTAPTASRETKPEPRTTGTRGGGLSYRMTAAPKTFNYMLAEDEPTLIGACFTLTSRLVDFDHSTLKYVGGLAETWTMQADGKTLDVKLRDGLKFSDGHALTTDDVIFSLEAIYDEKTQAAAFRDAMLVDDKPIATKKVSETEMQMIFPHAVASAENYLVNLGVLPAHVLASEQKAGKLAEAMKITSPPASIVSSGPFIVEAVSPGERVDFARNPNYWKKDAAGTQLPYLDKFTIEVIPDANNTLVRLTQGSLDIADRIRTNDFVALSKGEQATRAYDAGPGLGIDHIWFNLSSTDRSGKPLANEVKRSWFVDKRFRQAIAAAVDRETIASVTLQGLATPLYGFVSPANKVWLDPSLPKIKYSLVEADRLLTEAGFKKGGTAEAPVLADAQGRPVEFTLIVPAENEARKLMAAVVQGDLAKLGIKMQVAPIETAQLQEKTAKSFDYDAALFGLSQTDLEPSSYSNFLLSSAATHQWQPGQKAPASEWEKRIDELFDQQSVERDQQKRLAAFHEIQQIMSDQMPTIPIVARHVVTALNSRVANASPSSIMPYSLWNIEELFVKQ